MGFDVFRATFVLATAGAVAAGASFAAAQPSQGAASPAPPTVQADVTYVDAEQVAKAFTSGGRLANGPDFSASGLRRTGPGQSEVHEKETDIFYVVSGDATFVTGGTMVGGKLTRPSQWLGTGIDGGKVHQLKKGDVIVVPAGVPHWFKDVPTAINYYTVKVIKP